LRRFQDAQTGQPAENAIPYLTYQALGVAILRTREWDDVKKYLPSGFEYDGVCRSVVLIDEVDKAPRDFPNDLLNELELGYFRVPELGNVQIKADPRLEPIVIITSNSEKDLPDAFLRRCVYYNIPFPDSERLRSIVEARLGTYAGGSSVFLDQALDLFYNLRDAGLRKRPATAELLGWLLALRARAGEEENPLARPELVRQTLSILIKNEQDRPTALRAVETWQSRA